MYYIHNIYRPNELAELASYGWHTIDSLGCDKLLFVD